MLRFCPRCGNILMLEEGTSGNRFVCHSCPFTKLLDHKISHRIYPKLKEVDSVIGGSAAWENVDSTDAECPKCSHKTAYFMQVQTRSADEPMTTFYRCCNNTCCHNWRD